MSVKSEMTGFKRAQELAFDAAKNVANLMREGWTERQTAQLLDTWLQDHGVKAFFHHSYVWFGERTRFAGIRRRLYHEFMPGKRVLRPGDVVILDVAPILDGFPCDIGYSTVFGKPPARYDEGINLLKKIREELPTLFAQEGTSGQLIWGRIDQQIREAGFENIHKLYPFSVLGHRLHRVPQVFGNVGLLNFGWQSYWSFLSRGFRDQLLTPSYRGSLDGIWAIEPHLATPEFGVKFEEILQVQGSRAEWLGGAWAGS